MKNILITGGTGLIGKMLSEHLKIDGYNVIVLSRKRNNLPNVYYWDYINREIDTEVFNNLNGIIHLAGENIGKKRWTKKRKKEIINSRVESTMFLFEEIKKRNIHLDFYITASATGIYGAITSDTTFTEESSLANDFLGLVCKKWEESADRFMELGTRVVKLRTGVVLSKKESALDKIVKPIKMGIGAVLGTGKQFFPWIHISDLCRIYRMGVENEGLKGAYNAVANDHITNYDLTITLAKHLNRKIWLPNIPSFVFKIIYGEMSDIILKGSRVSSQKILDMGFEFKYSDIDAAFNDIL